MSVAADGGDMLKHNLQEWDDLAQSGLAPIMS